MTSFKTILILSIAAFMHSCSNIAHADKILEEHASQMILKLDTSNLQFLNDWDYSKRGDFWSNYSGDSVNFHCSFYSSVDSPKISAYQIDKFLGYFQSSLKIDTAYAKIHFTSIADTILKLVGRNNHGQETLSSRRVSLSESFPKKNPFHVLARLTNLKDTLNVIGISHYLKLGGFVQFYLPGGQHILTYLPDTLFNSKNLNKFWKAEFSSGKRIRPNWNFRKLENPIDGG